MNMNKANPGLFTPTSYTIKINNIEKKNLF